METGWWGLLASESGELRFFPGQGNGHPISFGAHRGSALHALREKVTPHCAKMIAINALRVDFLRAIRAPDAGNPAPIFTFRDVTDRQER
jgi:hypothetical protein